tara:strand:- start:4697 stop:5407 length:711 start_codon:yes stop_codon:yes gene_type:complete
MAYTERLDGRKAKDLRPMEAKAGVVASAAGSASFRIGKTWAIAAVYGPKEVFPRFLANPKKGILRCHYSMMPFSGSGERIRPGRSRRAQEISMVMEKALEPVVDLSDFPNSAVEIFIELPQTDAGTRCAAISAACIALADAGIPMRDMISSVAVGTVDESVVADLSYGEESYPAAVSDIPLAFLHNTGEISLLQMDGEISKENLIKALEMGKEVSEKIYQEQLKALKDRYPRGASQ